MNFKQFRVFFNMDFWWVKIPAQPKIGFDNCYPDSVVSNQIVKKWFPDLKRGRTHADDAEPFGRPNKVVTADNIKKKSTESF